ncbi:uncharacterized protein C8Q71DRAFT_792254 [Rhodofomes roseus]|uniref:Uncharacterized protein n=1 Tax=Rhodofomes roseus TaxID=34475 RepID=A0ABQ8JXG8_9APHY|nr:uncharacterized protein C8Q71DRAFT_792254 [Rhodofomes roseus]KAH9828803.1 hypothetical protein C8Q71DRAFT_792254 [Rhodofomes roseus]
MVGTLTFQNLSATLKKFHKDTGLAAAGKRPVTPFFCEDPPDALEWQPEEMKALNKLIKAFVDERWTLQAVEVVIQDHIITDDWFTVLENVSITRLPYVEAAMQYVRSTREGEVRTLQRVLIDMKIEAVPSTITDDFTMPHLNIFMPWIAGDRLRISNVLEPDSDRSVSPESDRPDSPARNSAAPDEGEAVDAQVEDVLGDDAQLEDATGGDAQVEDAPGEDADGAKDALGDDAQVEDVLGDDAQLEDATGGDALVEDAPGETEPGEDGEDRDDRNDDDEATGEYLARRASPATTDIHAARLQHHPYAQRAREANEAREREDRPALPHTSASPVDGKVEVEAADESEVEVEEADESEVEVEEADELVDSEDDESPTGPKGKGKARGGKRISSNSARKARAAGKGKASAVPKREDPEVDNSAPKWEGQWTLLMPATEKNDNVHAKFMGKWRCAQCKKRGATECVIRGLGRRCVACITGHRSPCDIKTYYEAEAVYVNDQKHGRYADLPPARSTTAPTTSKINPRKRMAVSSSEEMSDSPGEDDIVSRTPQSGKAKTAAKPKTKVAAPVSRTSAKSATATPNKRKKVDATPEAKPSSAKISARASKPGPSQKTADNKSTRAEARETITIDSDSEDDQPLRALVAGAASSPDAPEDAMDIDEPQVVDGKGKSRAGDLGQLPEAVQNDSEPDDHGSPWHGDRNAVVTMGWLGTRWKELMEQIRDRIEDEVESAVGYHIAKMQAASSKPQVPAHQPPEDLVRRPGWYPKYDGPRPTPINNLKTEMLASRTSNAAAPSSSSGAARSSSNPTASSSRNAAASSSKDDMAAFAPDTPTPKQRGGGSTASASRKTTGAKKAVHKD